MKETLLSALNNEFIEASDAFYSKNSSKIIYVYVEDEEDIPFWEKVCQSVTTHSYFEIHTLKSGNDTLKGKASLISGVGADTLGNRKILCVDSDYDELFDTNDYSKEVRDNPYIITTRVYSIENLKCHPDNLDDFIISISKVAGGRGELKNAIEDISIKMANLFLLHLVACSFKNSDISIYSDFSKLIPNIPPKGILDCEAFLNQTIHAVDEAAAHIVKYKDEINSMRSILLSKGFDEREYYLVMRGHDYANLVKQVVLSRIRHNCSVHFKELSKDSNDIRRNDHINHYRNLIGESKGLGQRLDERVFDCTTIEIEPFISLMRADIANAIV